MLHSLIAHPDCVSPPSIRIDAEVIRSAPAVLKLTYVMTGETDTLQIPTRANPKRQDGLWQHTCFEVFVRSLSALNYIEINLCPSGEWAGYFFEGYRTGMRNLILDPPMIETKLGSGTITLVANMALGDCGTQLSEGILQIGLSAVIEARDGTKSYWALAHPEGKADFHYPDSFVLQLPGPA